MRSQWLADARASLACSLIMHRIACCSLGHP
jgi:hypothetical protein